MRPRVKELVNRYLERFPCDPVPPGAIGDVESALGVVLPADLRAIAGVCRGVVGGAWSHFRIQPDGQHSIVDGTLALRAEAEVPASAVPLYRFNDRLALLMTGETDDAPAPVLCQDLLLAPDPVSGKRRLSEPVFRLDSYSDYFEALLEEAEVHDRSSQACWNFRRRLSDYLAGGGTLPVVFPSRAVIFRGAGAPVTDGSRLIRSMRDLPATCSYDPARPRSEAEPRGD